MADFAGATMKYIEALRSRHSKFSWLWPKVIRQISAWNSQMDPV